MRGQMRVMRLLLLAQAWAASAALNSKHGGIGFALNRVPLRSKPQCSADGKQQAVACRTRPAVTTLESAQALFRMCRSPGVMAGSLRGSHQVVTVARATSHSHGHDHGSECEEEHGEDECGHGCARAASAEASITSM